MRVALGRGGQAGGQMDRRLADILGAGFREDHGRVGRAHREFLDHGPEAVLHMGLQCLADVDLFSTDLIAHGSSALQVHVVGPTRNGRPASCERLFGCVVIWLIRRPFERSCVRGPDGWIGDEANANITSIRRRRAGAVNAKRCRAVSTRCGSSARGRRGARSRRGRPRRGCPT